MWYVQVVVADATYHKGIALTYASPERLEEGQVVVVPLRSKKVMGVVVAAAQKPKFPAKQVLEAPDIPPVASPLLLLLGWMQDYYPGPAGITAQLFLPKGLPKRPLPINPFHAHTPQALPPLTEQQAAALQAIRQPGLHLLHGDTGTGKTRVYIELAKQCLQKGKACLILTPEISLTSQLANDFAAAFGNRVIVVHSSLTDSVRSQTWRSIIEQTEPLIVIGPRSALFSPIKKLGLIVVDEAHETAYKQDQAPYYQTVQVAAKLAQLHQAIMVIGSATPSVSDYFIAQAKGCPVIRMTQLAVTNTESRPVITVVDLKNRAHFTKSPYLSDALITTIKESLARDEQSLLFLNRRGTARVIFCEACGWQAHCPHCDLPLVYHGDQHLVRCHSCGYKTSPPNSCPDCHSADVVFRTIGTKAVAAEVERLFPEARSMRFDSDNKKQETLQQHYDAVRSGRINIIIGTQTLAKGLDLPKLGTVGVVIADTSLYFPDFSAQERTYQLLSQVVGRVGRGHRKSQVIIQTYTPESPLLKAILTKDWSNFYSKEIAERKKFSFPPFCYILKLTCKRSSALSAQRTAESYASELRTTYNQITVDGPAPSFHEKQQDKFAWQLIIKAKRRSDLTALVKILPSGWTHDIDPLNLL